MKRFPHFKQSDTSDCGPTCLRIIAKYYGKNISSKRIKSLLHLSFEGTSLNDLVQAGEGIGLKVLAAKVPLLQLVKEAPLPFVAHWDESHYVVVYKLNKRYAYISDPASGRRRYSLKDFKTQLSKGQAEEGVVLLMQPTKNFYDQATEKQVSLASVFNYLRPYTKYFTPILLGLSIAALFQLAFPFLTQLIIDNGIENKDKILIITILFGMMSMKIGSITIEFIRNWTLLHIGARINISLVSDFITKMLKLPYDFFISRTAGDTLQRIGDHKRIEVLLTSTSLNMLFSIINILVFGVVLAVYDTQIFLIFIFSSLAYVLWISIFLKARRDIDHQKFGIEAANQNKIIQILNGILEVRLNNLESVKTEEWEELQIELYKISIKRLKINHYQEAGSFLINESKNLAIIYLASTAVIDGSMTLGMMVAILSISGQLNNPITQVVTIIRAFQDAKISYERLVEIQEMDNESDAIHPFPIDSNTVSSLILQNVSFRYKGQSEFCLKKINAVIKNGTLTAIVGASGSGKSTLLKILLKLFHPEAGAVRINDINLADLNNKQWRKMCGFVSTENTIFQGSILENINLTTEKTDFDKLHNAIMLSNSQDFIDRLPNGIHSGIGKNGGGLSQGQVQRLLIAREIYKDPSILLLDEATSKLDSLNEHSIIKGISDHFRDKLLIICTHRLAATIHADLIIVLDNGEIIEQGTHEFLLSKKGEYFKLYQGGEQHESKKNKIEQNR